MRAEAQNGCDEYLNSSPLLKLQFSLSHILKISSTKLRRFILLVIGTEYGTELVRRCIMGGLKKLQTDRQTDRSASEISYTTYKVPHYLR
jgi:hypothetical protein